MLLPLRSQHLYSAYHCESSVGSLDECRLIASRLPELRARLRVSSTFHVPRGHLLSFLNQKAAPFTVPRTLLGRQLRLNAYSGKSYAAYRMAPIPVTSSDFECQVTYCKPFRMGAFVPSCGVDMAPSCRNAHIACRCGLLLYMSYVPWSVFRVLGSPVSCAETAEPIEMPFWRQTRVGPVNFLLDGGGGS